MEYLSRSPNLRMSMCLFISSSLMRACAMARSFPWVLHQPSRLEAAYRYRREWRQKRGRRFREDSDVAKASFPLAAPA